MPLPRRLGSAVSPSGMNLAILSSTGVDLYSVISRIFLKTILLRPMDRALTVRFMLEGTIVAGGSDGNITIATVSIDSNPRLIRFPDTGPRKRCLHPLEPLLIDVQYYRNSLSSRCELFIIHVNIERSNLFRHMPTLMEGSPLLSVRGISRTVLSRTALFL